MSVFVIPLLCATSAEGAVAIVVDKGTASVEMAPDGKGFRALPCTVRVRGQHGQGRGGNRSGVRACVRACMRACVCLLLSSVGTYTHTRTRTHTRTHTHVCAVQRAMQMVGWRGRKTVRCLVGKHERLHFKLLVGAPPTLAEADGKKRRHEQRDAGTAAAVAVAQPQQQQQQQQQQHEHEEEDDDELPTKKAMVETPSGPRGVWGTIKSWFGYD